MKADQGHVEDAYWRQNATVVITQVPSLLTVSHATSSRAAKPLVSLDIVSILASMRRSRARGVRYTDLARQRLKYTNSDC